MAERRSTDKIHIDKTIPIYQIFAAFVVLGSTVIGGIVYQSGIDAEQNINISQNASDIKANKEGDANFQKYVMRSLDEINKRGERQEKEYHDFFTTALDILRESNK